jgi:hypothetical protein
MRDRIRKPHTILTDAGRKTERRYRFTGANDSVRLKNGITCS